MRLFIDGSFFVFWVMRSPRWYSARRDRKYTRVPIEVRSRAGIRRESPFSVVWRIWGRDMDRVMRIPFTNMVAAKAAGKHSRVQVSFLLGPSIRWRKDQLSMREVIIQNLRPAQAGAMMKRREWFM